LDIERTLEATSLVTTPRSRVSTPPEGGRDGPSRPGSASSPSAANSNPDSREAENGSAPASQPSAGFEPRTAPMSVPSLVTAHQGSASSIGSVLSDILVASNSPVQHRQRRGPSREVPAVLESLQEDSGPAPSAPVASPFATSPSAARSPRVHTAFVSPFAAAPASPPPSAARVPHVDFTSPFAADAAPAVSSRPSGVAFAQPVDALTTTQTSPFAQLNARDAAPGSAEMVTLREDGARVNTGTTTSSPFANARAPTADVGYLSPFAGSSGAAASRGGLVSPFADANVPPASGDIPSSPFAEPPACATSGGPLSSMASGALGEPPHRAGAVSSPFAD
jgi:hypothetical protein